MAVDVGTGRERMAEESPAALPLAAKRPPWGDELVAASIAAITGIGIDRQ